DVLAAQGDLPGALSSHQQGLEIADRLASSDPSNTQWQQDLAISLERMGAAEAANEQIEKAIAWFEKSRDQWALLIDRDPTNAVWQRGITDSLRQLASLYIPMSRHDEALSLAEQSLAISERLAALDPSNVLWQKDVAVIRDLVARLRGED